MLKRTLLLALLPFGAYAEELPAPVKAIEQQGITIIKSFDAPGGMKGYLGKYQDMGVTIYLTPDGKQAISGYMYNEKGDNLSNQLIEKEIYAPAGRELWQRMEKASWLLEGSKEAPVVLYVFADPFCPYCKQFWQQARPWVESGKVQLRTLLVGVIKPESPATAAAILAAKDPAKAWRDYENSAGKMTLNVPASIDARYKETLNHNEKIMDDLGANVTPAIYYMSRENTLQQVIGLPDKQQLAAMMESH
ncbi:thiol:disulfide interchange protein DsbG [Citrobacter rodentium]|jgi:Protein-disulfide isomerase|uniref:Thiol:disulfide interchange protein n=2 Tax=Citrobacter rodentium TaxID=67825 RepID=D2TMP5_CITRI|nr:thiol:disulfide interchange protein DsbG [Citrobacter rodentium]KIQ50947.1 disulfide isomerase [Citrobacter rodentium]QBY31828.1 thiol:disulfide interchange protein DsbG [Citrobacter rodentium]UHO30818.1 thiol:disulfide interchange protein DsbG [Citrobacter rodentium NBRC 105723 = DSM 16636]CBG87390.1 thiol:disulfide interchange protein [Citrobacter rodentium ICC168]HAT8013540.1 thiol:disulfide interchange protein DsbG [Citrobacter rodentium NBRC 105723 = DSM 16636]